MCYSDGIWFFMSFINIGIENWTWDTEAPVGKLFPCDLMSRAVHTEYSMNM